MDVFELAVSKFRGFGFISGFVYNLKNVCDFAVDASFVGDYLWF